MSQQKPWILGPKELLEHAEGHILSNGNSGFDLRIAMISIDNSIEIMIKTYLGLPERAKGRKGPPRKKMEEATGFPELLDLLEEYAGDLITGIELSDLEWYHRIRNALYHQGNGITVDINQVRAFHKIGILLFESLFKVLYKQSVALPTNNTAIFLGAWSELENRLQTAGLPYFSKPQHAPREIIVQKLFENKIIDEKFMQLFSVIQGQRNSAAHGLIKEQDIPGRDMADIMNGINFLINQLPDWKKTKSND